MQKNFLALYLLASVSVVSIQAMDDDEPTSSSTSTLIKGSCVGLELFRKNEKKEDASVTLTAQEHAEQTESKFKEQAHSIQQMGKDVVQNKNDITTLNTKVQKISDRLKMSFDSTVDNILGYTGIGVIAKSVGHVTGFAAPFAKFVAPLVAQFHAIPYAGAAFKLATAGAMKVAPVINFGYGLPVALAFFGAKYLYDVKSAQGDNLQDKLENVTWANFEFMKDKVSTVAQVGGLAVILGMLAANKNNVATISMVK